jgi:hypothetical protein
MDLNHDEDTVLQLDEPESFKTDDTELSDEALDRKNRRSIDASFIPRNCRMCAPNR